MTKTDPPITFPAPSADWGKVEAFMTPNPRWRWWAFWRRRTTIFRLDD